MNDRRWEFLYRERVRYSDCDMHGHLNHARYLSLLEQARVGYLEAVGMRVTARPQSIPMILVHASCDYRAPALINDAIDLEIGVSRIGGKSVTIDGRLWRVGDAQLLAEARTTLAWYDYAAMQTVPVPASFRAAVNQLKQAQGLALLPEA